MRKTEDSLFNKLFGNAAWLMLLSALASVLNYVFQIMLGNLLQVSEYGQFNLINSFASNILTFFTPLSMLACRITAEKGECVKSNDLIYRQLLKLNGIIGIIILVVGIAFYSRARHIYSLSGFFMWGTILVMIVVSGFYSFTNAVIQGSQRFVFYGIMGVFVVLAKAVLSYVFILYGYGVNGVVIAMLESFLLAFVIFCIYIKKVLYKPDTNNYAQLIDKNEIVQLYGFVFCTQLLYSFCINGGEMIFLGMFYNSEQIGLYACAGTLGKICLYATSVIATVLFPSFATAKMQGLNTESLYLKILTLMFVFSFVFCIGLNIVGPYLIDWLYGDAFMSSKDYLRYIVPLVLFLGEISITHSYYLGIDKVKRYLAMLVLAIGVAVVTIWMLLPPLEIAVVILGMFGNLITVMSVIDVLRRRKLNECR